MIKVELAFTTVAEAAAFFVAASGAAPVSPLPAIVEPPAPAPKAQHQRPPTEPKITKRQLSRRERVRRKQDRRAALGPRPW